MVKRRARGGGARRGAARRREGYWAHHLRADSGTSSFVSSTKPAGKAKGVSSMPSGKAGKAASE